MTGSIRNFENKNFTRKSRIFMSLKVKLPDMTDWHINWFFNDSSEYIGILRSLYCEGDSLLKKIPTLGSSVHMHKFLQKQISVLGPTAP